MSKSSRYEWRDQAAALQKRMKSFVEKPGNDQLAAVIVDMRTYAAAAKAGTIDIPERFVSFA